MVHVTNMDCAVVYTALITSDYAPRGAASGVENESEWEVSYTGNAGGILTVTSELGEPIHNVYNKVRVPAPLCILMQSLCMFPCALPVHPCLSSCILMHISLCILMHPYACSLMHLHMHPYAPFPYAPFPCAGPADLAGVRQAVLLAAARGAAGADRKGQGDDKDSITHQGNGRAAFLL